jgi:L,D-peptidoglycan transpeptidase YkuD (ErfK/YbiS/YcfS/YnhG family)
VSVAVVLTISCHTPPAPPEAREAIALERDLWRAGASVLSRPGYDDFRKALSDGQRSLDRENAKFGWFRDYEPVRRKFQDIKVLGTSLLEKIGRDKTVRAKALASRLDAFTDRVVRIKGMTDFFNENADVRRALAEAEIKSNEARLLVEKSEYEKAGGILDEGEANVRTAEKTVASLLARYLDEGQLDRWRNLAQKTIAESRDQGTTVILVNKLERKLSLYTAGALVERFDIGLGRYGLSDKLYSGDEATPEGKYRIVKIYPGGTFYKAMLIDYPNEDDRRAFAQAKKSGRVPAGASIGGAIEIHGGGKDSLTKGCIGLENKDMDVVFSMASVGTVVTIVGAVGLENTIAAEIKKFEHHD